MLRSLIEGKAVENECEVIVINRWEPTSQICSACGHCEGKQPLSVREWQCSNCGVIHDRDINTAKSARRRACGEQKNACGGEVRRTFVRFCLRSRNPPESNTGEILMFERRNPGASVISPPQRGAPATGADGSHQSMGSVPRRVDASGMASRPE